MNSEKPPLLEDANEEVAALIATLHATGRRLEQLTAGEVDTVADLDGRTFLLGRAQEQLRHIEATKQAAILNALPAHIAMLDAEGVILSVNDAWRRFGSAAAVQCPGHEIGANYLDICDQANAEGSEAHQVAEGIRSVLDGRAKSFSIEYPCYSPTEQRWFLMTANPLADDHSNGAVVMHLDITERRRTQAALAQSEDGLHRAEVVAKLAHVITGPDGSFERWSETLPQLAGVEPAALPRTTRAWLELLHPEDQRRFRDTALEAGIKKQRRELEYRLQKADGEWINVHQSMEPLKTVATQGLRWFNTLQDVTVQRRTEESLRASEARFRQMADNIRDVFFLVDAQTHRTLYLSPAFEEIWGRTRDSVYADTDAWTEAIHPDDRASTYDKYRQGISTGTFEYDYRIVRPDGAIRWIEARGFPVRDGAGKIVRIAGLATDITERKRVSDELWESERRFSSLLRNVEMVSLMLDANGRITYCNDYLLRLTGWQREEVIGRDWFELFIPPEAKAVKDNFAALLVNRTEARHGEHEILTRSGERRLVRWHNSVLWSGAGEVAGTASIGEDITEQKRDEIRIKRLNRVYAVLSGINTLIVRVRERDELFREACRIAVQSGQFLLAWVAVADPRDQLVKAVAWAGDEGGFVQLTRPTVGTKGQGKAGLSAQAMETRAPVVCNDIEADGSGMRYAKEALERGYRSAAALPLVLDGTAVGALVLYAAEAGFFDDEEMRLLQELAGDISFAIGHIEKARKLERMTRVNAMLSGINGAIVRIRDRQELFEEACRIAVETGGLRFASLSMVDEAGMQLRPVASAGADGDVPRISHQRLSLRDDAPEGHGKSARAVREGRAIVVDDVRADADMRHKKAQADRGIKSIAALPLFIGGKAIGVFALYAPQVGFFDADEMKLLNEVAANIAFALEHIEKEEKVRRLTRVYAVLSGINTLIVRVRNRDELFREACRIAVEHGRFHMAWIGLVDRSAQQIVPVASAGAEPEFLALIQDRLSLREDAPPGSCIGARTVREKKVLVSNDIRDDPRIFFAKERMARGISSLAVLPLLISDEVVGVLALYAREIGFFDEEEMKLLTELAGDIAFALEHLAGQQKLENLSRIRAVSSEINAAIVRIPEREGLLRETARIAVEHGKFEMVWIATLDHEQKVHPVAWPGFSAEAAQAVSWASISAVQGTLGEAMQTRKPAVRNDIGELPLGGLRQEAVRKGCRSTVCLPLVVDDKVVALIALFAQGVGFFDSKELALLNEVTADVSFALQAIEKRKELEYLSYYDALTGLANRSLFLERVAQYMRSAAGDGKQLGLFLVDVERFKSINDSLGRPAGDALLRQVAEWLTRNLGDANLLARVGADHFAVVLPQVRRDGNVARLVENTIDLFMQHPFRLNDAVFRIAFKAGGALFPDDGADADTLYKNAEAALKQAKASGERYLFYKQKMTEAVAGKLTLENQLRQALDKEEFVLHYQPKVSLASGKLTSAEALIRWNDPRTGLVPPGRFIPVLEETGLIQDVGRWALRKALEDYLRWRAAGLPAVRIAVNVSPLQLRHRGFLAEIEQTVGIDPHAAAGLELEITESMIMEDVKHNIASLQAIRAMGVTIAIDDFGTGFSSLAYLSRLPVDTLKIDRSFVIDMTAGAQGLALVSTIINLAHSLKLKVVAEGVETEEQSRLLRLLGCDEMQGYLFSKPVPAEIFEARFLAAPAAAISSSSVAMSG